MAMVNLQEAIQLGMRLAQFALGLVLATVSAVQEFDLAGPAATMSVATEPQAAQPVPAAAAIGFAEAEQSIFEQINAERTAAGLAPLALDPALTEVARLRAADMLARGYLSHYDPVTGERADWPLEAQYGLPLGGELIYWTTASPEQAAARAVPWWMGSEGHRAGLMGEYGRGGVGLGVTGGKTIVVALLSP